MMKAAIKKLLTEGLLKLQNQQLNAKAEVDRLRVLPKEAEDGVTLNLDGTKYTGDGLVIPVTSVNLPQEQLSTGALHKFMQNNAANISRNGNFKFGIYKFPNNNLVSLDLNIIVDEANRDVALEFAKRAGQESLFNLGTFNNEKTGADGLNPRKFTPEEFKEIADSLNKGMLPRAVQNGPM